MAKDELICLEFEMEFTCTGCQNYKWNQDGLLDSPEAEPVHGLRVLPEPDNQYDKQAVAVTYGFIKCGYVKKECLADMHLFLKAYSMVMPFVKEFGSPLYVGKVWSKDEVVTAFEATSKVLAWVPTTVAEEFDKIAA